ncbi:MAG TPA: hypothetical protein VIL85_01630 [Thermomicrobiales bacterium]|jgi:hypothetical protein
MQIDADGLTLPYREALRALGWQLDRERLAGLRLDMRGEDLVIEAYPVARPGHVERARLAPAGVLALWNDERWLRYRPGAGHRPTPHPSGLGYREALRVLGQEMDRRGARLVRVIEHADGLIVQRLPAEASDAPLATELLRWETLQAQRERAIQRRSTG